MSVNVVMAKNPLAPETWTRHEVEDVRAFLLEEMGTWPETARIYHRHVAQSCDVTPKDAEGVRRLAELDGTLYVVVYPEGPIAIVIAIVAVAAVAAAAFLLMPKVPGQRNMQARSPNNELAERTNIARPGGRIPDIFGKVRSTPDLIAVPYKVFKNHQEVEVAYMCVGRGTYDILDVRDDTTSIAQVEGSSVEVYGPNTSPNSGSPQMTIGAPITDELLMAKRSNAVNGQTLEPGGAEWVGPFVLNVFNMTKVIANVVAPQGMFKDDGEDQTSTSVQVELELTPVNAVGTVTGPPEVFSATVVGSSTLRSTRAATIMAQPTFTGRCQARMRRITPKDTAFEGTVVDEVKWRDLYATAPVTEAHFGDVTTVFAVTNATDGALAIKERKLNMLVERQLPRREADGTFSSTLYATRNVADIVSHICLDPSIGRRPASQVDFDGIYDAAAEIASYFGTAEAAEFSYTFDKDNLSLEETLATVASAVFSTAYRRGSTISLRFERENPDSSLLFSHRNKVPGSESRTVTFGRGEGFDGVAYEYISPVDDALVTMYVPQGEASAVNPRKVESAGVRSPLQAYFHAWRIWNRTKYQTTVTEFEAMQEADLLVPTDRILVADNTRPDTTDGEVLAQDVLLLTLSQPVELDPSKEYTIFLQSADGSVEAIGVTQGPADDQVLLEHAPAQPLSLDEEMPYRTAYVITGPDNERTASPFLVMEKDPQEGFTVRISAANYDARYYGNDKDFATGIIDASGNPRVDPDVDPVEDPEPGDDPNVTITINPQYGYTSSSTSYYGQAGYTVSVSGGTPTSFSWGLHSGDGQVASGANSAMAVLGAWAYDYWAPGTAEFYCDVVVNGSTYRAYCSHTHSLYGDRGYYDPYQQQL